MSAEAAVDLHEQILDDEIVGTTHRTLHYFLPRFEDFRRARRLDASQTAVLDLGCGNGVAIELLRERGYRAVGIDLFPERYRRRRRAYVSPLQRFVQASALALPFADGSFDSVFSCGVLEHIGVEETYLPWVLRVPPDRADIRRHYLAECLRVLRPDGILYVDHPNGACPVDFWHHDTPGRLRWHRPYEGFCPSLREVRSLLAEVRPGWRAVPITPATRFAFRRVERRWFGRLLRAPMGAWLELLGSRWLRPLLGGPLNPYLVTRISAPDIAAPR